MVGGGRCAAVGCIFLQKNCGLASACARANKKAPKSPNANKRGITRQVGRYGRGGGGSNGPISIFMSNEVDCRVVAIKNTL